MTDTNNDGNNGQEIKITNDINCAFSIRALNGRKLKHSQVIKAILTWIANWEDNSDEFLSQVYKDELVQFSNGDDEEVVMFGVIFSDQHIYNRIMEMREMARAMHDIESNSSNAETKMPEPNNDDENGVPSHIVEAIRNLIRDNNNKNGGQNPF